MEYYVYNRPENKVHYENPVRFTWYPLENVEDYRICVYNIQGEIAYEFSNIDINFYTPSVIMEAGKYTYSIYAGKEEIVKQHSFELSPEATLTPLPSRHNRYDLIGDHPRIWLNTQDIERLALEKETLMKADWDAFIDQGVKPWLATKVHKEPSFYPNNKKQLSLWRKMYIDCQESVYAVKHCAVAWRVTKDPLYLKVAREWLLGIAHWDVNGATARSYNDEAAFRVTSALAWGYDWLFDSLSKEEKAIIKQALLLRGRELFNYVKNDIQIHIKLLDSHGVRSLSMTLIPTALALYGEEEEAKLWLDYTLEYFFTIFTPWGGDEGGWAEGPAYWQTGISLFTEAICLIQKSIGISVFKRPFFQNTGDFPLFTYSQDLRHMAFGDQSDLGDYPGLKAGYTLRILSAVSDSPNNQLYAWYFEEAKKRGVGTEGKFYNYGWWNFQFDELFYKMLFEPTKAERPSKNVMVKWFKDVGWVCLHKDMADHDRHIAFMFKSSPYGSVSHSHGDQNAFVLHAFGEPLLIQSGYYIGFRSDMHVNWRRETKSKNAILIDQIGQYVEMKKPNAAEDFNGSAKSQFENLIDSKGRIEVCRQEKDYIYMCGDASEAFAKTLPYLKEYKRKIYFVAESFFVMIDEIELEQEGKIDWLLHSLNPFEIGKNQAFLKRGKANLDIQIISHQMEITQSDCFEGVDNKEIEGLDLQWHLKARTLAKDKSFKIVSLLYPYKDGEKKELKVVDDRGNEVLFDGQNYYLNNHS